MIGIHWEERNDRYTLGKTGVTGIHWEERNDRYTLGREEW